MELEGCGHKHSCALLLGGPHLAQSRLTRLLGGLTKMKKTQKLTANPVARSGPPKHLIWVLLHAINTTYELNIYVSANLHVS